MIFLIISFVANGKCSKNHSFGCYAASFAAEKYDGLYGIRQNESSLLYIDFEYHSSEFIRVHLF